MRKALSLLLLFFWNCAAAQSAKEEFDHILSTYKKGSLAFDGQITMRVKGKSGVVDALPVKYQVGNGNYYCSIGDIEISGGEQYMIQLDHSAKSIVVARRQTASRQPAAMPVMDLDILKQMLPDEKDMIRLEKGKKYNKLLIQMPVGSGVTFYEMQYVPGTHYITQVIMEVEAGDGTGDVIVLQMQYRNFNTAAPLAFRKESDYFTVTGKTIRPNKAYAGYRLISEL